MTKADRQTYEAIQRRQSDRRLGVDHHNGKNDIRICSEAVQDVDYCLELIATLKREVERLEKVRR